MTVAGESAAGCSSAAAAWERRTDWYEGCARPIAEWAAAALDARPGRAVLDVGCGAGFPAVALAERVRPGGRVVATDLSPDMTDVVARRARRLGLETLETRPADLADLPFADGTFDAVSCCTALMFCPDLVRGATEMRRVLKAGGRIAVVAWDEPAKNPYFDLALGIFSDLLPRPAGADGPPAFRLAPPGALEGVLNAAGFADVVVESRPLAFECATPQEYVGGFLEMSGLGRRLSALPGEVERRCADLAARARAYAVEGGRVRLGAAALCASARKA